MSKFSRLTEAQIEKARAEGQLDNLEGAGKPLPKREGEAYQDAGLEIGLRAMAQAGVVPEEIAFKKAMEAAKAAYAEAQNENEKKRIMKAMADLDLQYEIAKEARKKFFR